MSHRGTPMDDPVSDAESELHEMERAARRAAAGVAPASDRLAREFEELQEHIRLVGWRVRMERRVGQGAAA